MNRDRNNLGFSLTEMLIATGIMAIGLVMVATIFPVGVKLTSMSTERTIGAVVADEAFAKIQLYGLRDFHLWPTAQIAGTPAVTSVSCNDFQYASLFTEDFGVDGFYGTLDDVPLAAIWPEFRYPSTVIPAGQERNYHWSALCRRVGAKDVQVTVFVTRKVAAASQYHAWDFTPGAFTSLYNSPWPKPVPVSVEFTYSDTVPLQNKQVLLTDPQPNIFGSTGFDIATCKQFFGDGYTIVDNYSGQIYRVLEVDYVTGTLTLQQDWQWGGLLPPSDGDFETRTIWVVPPAVNSDRYPCVGVYQKTIYFENIN